MVILAQVRRRLTFFTFFHPGYVFFSSQLVDDGTTNAAMHCPGIVTKPKISV